MDGDGQNKNLGMMAVGQSPGEYVNYFSIFNGSRVECINYLKFPLNPLHVLKYILLSTIYYQRRGVVNSMFSASMPKKEREIWFFALALGTT